MNRLPNCLANLLKCQATLHLFWISGLWQSRLLPPSAAGKGEKIGGTAPELPVKGLAALCNPAFLHGLPDFATALLFLVFHLGLIQLGQGDFLFQGQNGANRTVTCYLIQLGQGDFLFQE